MESFCLGIVPNQETDAWISQIRSSISGRLQNVGGPSAEFPAEPCITLVPPDSFARKTLERFAETMAANFKPFELTFLGLDASIDPLHTIFVTCGEAAQAAAHVRENIAKQTGVPITGAYVPHIDVARYRSRDTCRRAWDHLRAIEYFHAPHTHRVEAVGVYGKSLLGPWELMSQHLLTGVAEAA